MGSWTPLHAPEICCPQHRPAPIVASATSAAVSHVGQVIPAML